MVAAVQGVVALHSSDPITPYLAVRSRMRGFVTTQLDLALYEARSLRRLHAMRRTLWVAAAEDVPTLDAAVGAKVAARERRRLEGWLAAEMPAEEVGGWLARAAGEVRGALDATAAPRSTRELSEQLPEVAISVTVGPGKLPVLSRLLFLMAMEGHVLRGRPAGSWRSSQYRWSLAQDSGLEGPAPADARAELARRYLASFGPVTELDLRWWAGWTAREARGALERVATTVQLDSGDKGYVLADDLAREGGVPSHASLLPGLDPTPMGWKERDWYLGPHADLLFDRNGNAGPTVWVDGRVVGGWAQRGDGKVVVRLLEEIPGEAVERVREEADELERWLDGQTVTPRFRNPLERELAGS